MKIHFQSNLFPCQEDSTALIDRVDTFLAEYIDVVDMNLLLVDQLFQSFYLMIHNIVGHFICCLVSRSGQINLNDALRESCRLLRNGVCCTIRNGNANRDV